MKFSQLSIQTQRAAPSEIRTDGLAFLYRAGYASRSGEILSLGQLVLERLRQSFEALTARFGSSPETVKGFFVQIGLNTVKSHETDDVFAIIASGSDEILLCPACGYASSRELARTRKQPYSSEAALPLKKILTPECNTIAQLAVFMQLPQEKTAKALMFTRLEDGKFVFVVVRGDMQLSESKLKARVGEVRLATAAEIAASGAVAGYASPIGLREALVVVDDLVASSPNLVAGANEHGYHLQNTNYPRDYQAMLVADVTQAAPGDACPECTAALERRDASIVSSNGQIQFEKLLLTLAEIHHDEKGLTLSAHAAPFDVYLMQVPGKTLDTLSAAETLYQNLTDAGLSTLFDDRDERAGVKFNDADLIGCPIRVTVGERGLQSGMVELKSRIATENQMVALADIVSKIKEIL